jgi:hypothetical protein
VLGHTRSLGFGTALQLGLSATRRIYAMERADSGTITTPPPFLLLSE